MIAWGQSVSTQCSESSTKELQGKHSSSRRWRHPNSRKSEAVSFLKSVSQAFGSGLHCCMRLLVVAHVSSRGAGSAAHERLMKVG